MIAVDRARRRRDAIAIGVRGSPLTMIRVRSTFAASQLLWTPFA
jgi:hypothetical protein